MSILTLVLLLFGQVSDVDNYAHTEWLEDSRVLACSLDASSEPNALILSLGPDHGRELAIRRVADNTWYFLVVGLAPKDVPQLMTPEAFSEALRVEVPTAFKSRAWTEGSALEPVVGLPGTYEVYVSDNLESEIGGHTCTFQYTGVGPNNSFKGMPLRGTP